MSTSNIKKAPEAAPEKTTEAAEAAAAAANTSAEEAAAAATKAAEAAEAAEEAAEADDKAPAKIISEEATDKKLMEAVKKIMVVVRETDGIVGVMKILQGLITISTAKPPGVKQLENLVHAAATGVSDAADAISAIECEDFDVLQIEKLKKRQREINREIAKINISLNNFSSVPAAANLAAADAIQASREFLFKSKAELRASRRSIKRLEAEHASNLVKITDYNEAEAKKKADAAPWAPWRRGTAAPKKGGSRKKRTMKKRDRRLSKFKRTTTSSKRNIKTTRRTKRLY